jgi:PAS domain S-box-containing protein/putative nucleotidyltransferase with HDIG domain
MTDSSDTSRNGADNYRLADLIDLALLQKMADAHYRTAGMPIGIIDAQDNTILVGAGWQDICLKFHRANPVSRTRCETSDNYIKGHLVRNEACAYKCANGLWDIGIPIIVADRHLATLFLGQFFYQGETPDREFFKRQAREFGYATVEYLAALDRVPVFSRDKVDYIIAYDRALAGFIADLAEHALAEKRTDRELRYTNTVLKAQQEESTDGILVVNDKQEMISFNKKFVEMWGIPAAVAEARSNEGSLRAIRRVLARPDEYFALIRRVYEHPDRKSFDEIALKDGRIFEQYSAPMRGPDGTYYGRVWQFRDITERRRAETMLRQSNLVVENSPAVLFRWKAAEGWPVELVSGNVVRFGYTPEEFLTGKIDYSSIVYSQDRERVVAEVKEYSADKRIDRFHLEYRIIDRDGKVRWVEDHSVIERDAGGRAAGYQGVIIDITERRKAEAAFRESELRFSTFFKLSPMSMVITTLEDGCVYEVNHTFEKLFGIPRDEAIGRTTLDVGIFADPQERQKLRHALMDQETVEDLELNMKSRDGRPITLLLSGARIRIGRQIFILSAGTDITERKRAAAALKESYEKVAKSLDGVINAITAIVEIRDPYTAGHQKRTSRLACAIASEMQLSRNQIEGLRIAAALHDIGKIYVPAEILAKPGRLSLVEMAIVKAHARASYEILKKIDFPWPVAEIALEHQERYDGTGYPQGLAGNDILPEARILAVADTLEAMMVRRPYRPAVGTDNALDEIMRNRGAAYDPAVVDAAVTLLRDRHFSFELEEQAATAGRK